MLMNRVSYFRLLHVFHAQERKLDTLLTLLLFLREVTPKAFFFFPRCYSKKAQRTVLGHSPSCDFTINYFWLQLPPPLCHMVLANMEEETTSFRQVSGKSWLRRLERRENAKGRKNRCRSFSSKVNK